MTTPANASAAYKKEIIEITNGSKVFTVGAGQQYATLDAAIQAANALGDYTTVASATADATATADPSTEDKRIVTLLTTIADTTLNVADARVILDGGIPIPVISIANKKLMTAHQLLSNHSLVDVSVVVPIRKTILIAAGHEELLASTLTPIGSFTTIVGAQRDTVRLTTDGAFGNITEAVNATEVILGNLILASNTKESAFPVSFNNPYDSKIGMFGITMQSAAYDAIRAGFIPDAGALFIHDCDINGRYDAFRLGSQRELFLTNSRLDSFCVSEDKEGQATAIAIGATSVPTRPSNMYIANNQLRGFSQTLNGTVDPGEVRVVDIRNALHGDSVINISNNNITAYGDSDLYDNSCIRAEGLSSAGETPTIIASGNTFNSVNLGTGAAYTMHSDNAAYDILSAGNNVVVAGTTGTNVNLASVV